MEPFWVFVLVCAAFMGGRASRNSEFDSKEGQITNLIASNSESRSELKATQDRLGDKTKKLATLLDLFQKTLSEIRTDSVLLPSLARWADAVQEEQDEILTQYLATKKHPARKASEEVREAKAECRAAKKDFNLLLNRLEFYESLAPWLVEYDGYTVIELLQSMKEERKLHTSGNVDDDPITRYVPRSEWKNLSESARNQLALDRYLDQRRKKGLWSVGIDYERYIGYLFEQDGYAVEYHGATKGKTDLGIDLICKRGSITLIVQCKRLSELKQIPVRENIVAQVFGAAEYYKMEHQLSGKVRPVLITSYVLSDTARQFAKHLNVGIEEWKKFNAYPTIKCNVSTRSREKIYHLPMDLQYDNVIIGDQDGEFFARTVKEAEAAGFRRAYTWKGSRA